MTPVVNVNLINFTRPGTELVMQNEDGSYTVLINAKISYEHQLKAYAHALKHIKQGDFEKTNVQHIETIAHDIADIKKEPIEEKYPNYARHLRRRRAKRRKQQREMDKRISFLQENGHDFFGSAEESYLYGRENI